MGLSAAEKEMIMDLRREINELKRERTRLRTGTVTGTGPVLKIKLGGDCGGTEIAAIGTSPLEVGDVVSVIEGGGGVSVLGEALTGGQPNLASGPGIEILGKIIQVDASVARKDAEARLIGIGNPSEWNHGANKAYVDLLTSLTIGNIPEVTSLPSGPLNGQTVLFNGWLCRFDSSPPNALYPWAVLGGSLFASNDSNVVISAASFAAIPGGSMSLTIPAGVKGIFDIEIGGQLEIEAPNSLYQSYTIGSMNASSQWGTRLGAVPPDLETFARVSHKARHTITQAGATIAERAEKSNSGRPTWLAIRWMEITPKWIGT